MNKNVYQRRLLSLAVLITLTAQTGHVYGETISYNGRQAEYDQLEPDKSLTPSQSASNNVVNVADPDNLSSTDTCNMPGVVYGGYVDGKSDVHVTGNVVTFSGGGAGTVYGGYGEHSDYVSKNHVILTDGARVSGRVYGGYKNTGEGSVAGNTVTLKRASVMGRVIGGLKNYATGLVTGNTVTLSEGARVKGDVFGGSLIEPNQELIMGYVSVNDNTVNLSDSAVEGNVYGGVANWPSENSNNKVFMSGGSVGGSIYGGWGGSGGGNLVSLTGGTIGGGVYGGSNTGNTVSVRDSYVSGNIWGGCGSAGEPSGNNVTLTGGAAGKDVYGGYGGHHTVSLSGNATAGSVYGGFTSGGGDISGNAIYLSDHASDQSPATNTTTVGGNVYGGYNLLGTDNVSGNSVFLSGGSVVAGNVIGGRAFSGSTVGNAVSLADSEVKGSVYGGYKKHGEGNVSGNTVILSGGTKVDGDVYGGYVFQGKGTTTDNHVILTGGTVTGGIYGGIDSTTTSDNFTGNTLTVASAKDETLFAGSIKNFERIEMNLSNLSATTKAIAATGDATFGTAPLGKKTLININGVNALSEVGRVLISAGGAMSGAYESVVGGMVMPDYIRAVTYVRDNNLILDYVLKWADDADSTFTLEGAASNFTIGADLADTGGGSRSLTKAGDGTLTLTGNNTYSGGTAITAGTLALGSVRGAGTGAIANNARLAFTGARGRFGNTVYGDGDVAVEAGSFIMAAGALDAGSVFTDATSRLSLEQGITWRATRGFSNAGTLVLDDQSSLTGSVENAGTLALTERKSVTAHVDGDLTNRGTVLLNPTPASAGNALIITGDYRGEPGSSLSLGAVLRGDDSLTDSVSILGSSSGSSALRIANENGAGAQTLEGIRVVSVQGNSGATFTQANRVVAGLYDYNLIKKGNNWYLTSRAVNDNDNPNRLVRPEAAGYTANLQAANALFMLNLYDLIDEIPYRDALTGEVRTTSLWMRSEGGRTNASMKDGQNKTRGNRYVLQMGGDVLKHVTDAAGTFSLGITGGNAHASGRTMNVMKGHGSRNSVSGFSTGAYGMWRQSGNEKVGPFVGGALQYGWLNNSVQGQSLTKESYNSRGLTALLETGYDVQAGGGNTADGWSNTLWVRPLAQMVWTGIRADDHTERNGTHVQGMGNDNVRTTLGIRVWLDGKSDAGRGFHPYAEVSWVNNARHYGVRMNGSEDVVKGAQNATGLKAGAEVNVSPCSSLRAGVSGLKGGSDYLDVAATLGGSIRF